MVLYVHRSERADRLVDILGEVLAEPLDDPMVTELVAVPTRGVERWLAQRLSHRLGASVDRADGVCANIAFPFPGALVNQAAAAAIGLPGGADPWLPERSVWPLLDLVDAHLDEPFLRPLASHLRSASPSAPAETPPGHPPATTVPAPSIRRFATVRHLADLYDHYGVHRPAMIVAWAAGSDRLGEIDLTTRAVPPGAGLPLWQAELWRRLRRRIGVDSPTERVVTAADRLAASPTAVGLPPRLSLFGLTRLPASHLAVLQALAVWRDVHLFLLHPSGALWDKVSAVAPPPPGGLRRRDDPTATWPANPLLRSWGRDGREMQLVLASHQAVPGRYDPIVETSSSLLRRIQADIRADREPPVVARPGDPDPRPPLDATDRSVQVHACHGRSRQVEVMRDAVLHLLAADPGLEPRDVIIMCPDIETFAPLVQAAFDAGDGGLPSDDPIEPAGDRPPSRGSTLPELRVRLADRSLLQTNPLLAMADLLLELAGSRITASQVLDLASREPVRRRFQLDEEGRAQLERWVGAAGIRWGLDGSHRARWGLPRGLDVNSWSTGLDRLLLGVAMAEDDERLFAGTLPLDDVVSSTVDLAGHVAELIERLRSAVGLLSRPQSIRSWRDGIASSTESLATVAPADGWQRDQLFRVLDEVVEEAGRSAGVTILDLAEARSLLTERLKGRPTRANFRTGDLTVCTLVPMRSVPHRVVGLLGLDDGVFPRHTERDGDDLLAGDPQVGDRDARSEDRQLLLDAVLAATDHLVITFSGRDERTNRERPPAVPIAELLDVVDRTVRVDGPHARARDAVLVWHPLQSFDPRNFTAGPGGLGPWSFDPVSLDGARALSAPRRAPRHFLSGPLLPLDGQVVQLDSLVRFVEHPVKAFLRERLGWYAGNAADEVSDALPIELSPLAKWEVGDRLLAARLAGADLRSAAMAEQARGILPPGRLVDAVLGEVVPTVEALVAAAAALPGAAAEPRSLDVNVRLPDGRLLIGVVPGVRDGMVLRCVYSRLGPKHRLASWVRFLAVSAAWPDRAISGVMLGRGRHRAAGLPLIRTSLFPPLGPPDARGGPAAALARLTQLVDLYDRGIREPLPIYCATSAAWAETRRLGGDPTEPALRAWKSSYDFPGEDVEAEHLLVLGGEGPFDALLQPPPAPDESGPGWEAAEPSRFGRLARRLWDDLLAHEQTEER